MYLSTFRLIFSSANKTFSLTSDFSQIKIASVAIAVLLYVAYCVGRIGVGEMPSLLPLVISITLLLLPDVVCKDSAALQQAIWQAGILLFFFILGWTSIVFGIDFVLLIWGLFFLTVFLYLRRQKFTHGKRQLIKWSIILCIALRLITIIWTQDYLNPLSPQSFGATLRYVHVDTLFLTTLTSIIKTYHVASLGLFGLEPLRYHSGSSYLFASYAQLCKISILDFYNFAFPVIFVPLYVKCLLQVCLASSKGKLGTVKILTVLAVLFFVLSGYSSRRIGGMYLLPATVNSHFLSQSYCISLLFTFLCICVYKPLIWAKKLHTNQILNNLIILAIPLCFFVIGYTKLSTAVVIFSVFIYIILRKELFFEKWIFISALLSAAVLYYVLQQTIEATDSTFTIKWGAYYKTYVKGNIVTYFLLQYLWFILFTITTLLIFKRSKSNKGFSSEIRSGKFIVIELLIVAAVVGIIPGFLIHIDGGSALYFSDIQYWLSAIAFISVAPYYAFKYYGRRKLWLVITFTVMVITISEGIGRGLFSFFKKNIKVKTAMAYGATSKFEKQTQLMEFGTVMQTLTLKLKDSKEYARQTQMTNLALFKRLRSLPALVRKQSLIYCEDPTQLEEFLSCAEASFYITAMSEIALINGTYWVKKCDVISAYGMHAYYPFPSELSKKEAFTIAKKKGFENVIVLNLKKSSYEIVKL